MGQWIMNSELVTHDPCDLTRFVDLFNPWPTDPLSDLQPVTLGLGIKSWKWNVSLQGIGSKALLRINLYCIFWYANITVGDFFV